jgi:general secretion pathway protein F/type IV pilus assembly protein PilC
LAEIQELRSQVKMALIYPTFLALAGLAAMVVFMAVLVPQMLKLFEHSGTQMPLPTYILFMMGKFFQKYGILVLSVSAIIGLSFYSFIQQPFGRAWWDRFKLNIPLFGALWYASFHGEFCQLLANLLNNGLPLVSSLKLMSRATGNTFFNGTVIRLGELVSEGVSLTQAMKTVGQFPPNLRDLVKVGEQTGELGTCLEKIGKRYEKLIKRQMDAIMSLVQPIIILVIGCMVALVMWSMLSGIFGAMHAIRGHTE